MDDIKKYAPYLIAAAVGYFLYNKYQENKLTQALLNLDNQIYAPGQQPPTALNPVFNSSPIYSNVAGFGRGC